ncbi:hypothetical protein ACQEVY_32705 [Streptomyces sp. CA-288835]|uniref:hypothetical protein n=1 Tax=Streptomyces sp. CA-288835 TaxID=3240069 RepID=UPI003D8C4D5D
MHGCGEDRGLAVEACLDLRAVGVYDRFAGGHDRESVRLRVQEEGDARTESFGRLLQAERRRRSAGWKQFPDV